MYFWNMSNLCREDPDEMVVHEESLEHLSHLAGLHVSYFIS